MNQSLSLNGRGENFLGTMIVAALKRDETTAWNNKALKMLVSRPASWSTHYQTTCLGMSLGPATFRTLIFLCYF